MFNNITNSKRLFNPDPKSNRSTKSKLTKSVAVLVGKAAPSRSVLPSSQSDYTITDYSNMAYRKPRSMDEFVKVCIKGDTKLRQTVGADLVIFLADDENPIECEDIGSFIDTLVQWIQGSNYKVRSPASYLSR